MTGRERPILLKKSAMVCASEKYASEIEIFTFGRGIPTRISPGSVQRRRFHQSMIRQFGQSDFFNRIGRFLSVATVNGSFSAGHGHAACWSDPMQITGQVECKWVGKSVQLPILC